MAPIGFFRGNLMPHCTARASIIFRKGSIDARLNRSFVRKSFQFLIGFNKCKPRQKLHKGETLLIRMLAQTRDEYGLVAFFLFLEVLNTNKHSCLNDKNLPLVFSLQMTFSYFL
jgi:hypothetical protein